MMNDELATVPAKENDERGIMMNDKPSAIHHSSFIIHHSETAGPRRSLLIVWLALRLAILGLGLYFLPGEMTWLATILAIHLIGSLPERLALFLLLSLILAGSFIITRRLSPQWAAYLLPLVIAFSLFSLLLQRFSGLQSLTGGLFLTIILALNSLPEDRWAAWLARPPGSWLADLLMIGLIGLAELLLLKPFLGWLRLRWQNSAPSLPFAQGKLSTLYAKRLSSSASPLPPCLFPAVVTAPALAVLLLSPYHLADLHRTLFPDPAVQIFARGNFNGLELDLEQRRLYAAGSGTDYLQAYQLDALDRSPHYSAVETGYAQGFGYNPLEQELYVYDQAAHQLLTLDAARLDLKKRIDLPQLAPGDAWVVWDKFTGNVIIASEADEWQGIPVVIINPTTEAIIDTLDIAPGFILPHPAKPLFFMSISFFQENDDLIVYNSQLRQVVKKAAVAEPLDRLALAVYNNELELLAPSALDSAVLRFDPETLEYKGRINSLFGVRAIAIDPVHNLLLSGSLVTHKLEVIDLASRERLATYTIGPWLRTITLDSQAGLAYISSHEGLFKVDYATGTR